MEGNERTIGQVGGAAAPVVTEQAAPVVTEQAAPVATEQVAATSAEMQIAREIAREEARAKLFDVRDPETEHEGVIADLAHLWNLGHLLDDALFNAWNDLKGLAGSAEARSLLLFQLMAYHHSKA